MRGRSGLVGLLVAALAASAGCRKPANRQSAADAGRDASPVASTLPPPAASVVTVTSVVAVTQASPAWDAGAPVVAEGKVDGVELRRRTHERLAADQSPVHVLVGDDVRALGKAACEATVPHRPAATPVLIKPNFTGFEWFKDPEKSGGDDGVRGRTTDPEFVRGVIECLQARGHRHITVADGWAGSLKDWPRCLEVSGYGAMAKATGVEVVALADDGKHDQGDAAPGKPLAIAGVGSTPVPTLLMPKAVADHLDHGLYIMIPKLKAHRFSVVSLGIKNLQGTVMYSDASPAYRQKWRSHREISAALELLRTDRYEGTLAYVAALDVFARRMVAVLELEAPHVVILEGAPAMSGDGFERLEPSAEKVAIAGTNVITVDRVGSQFLGLWENAPLRSQLAGRASSPLITKAAHAFGVDLDHVEVVGNGAHLIDQPRPYYYHSMSGFEIRGTAPAPAPATSAAPAASASVAPRPAPAASVSAATSSAPATTSRDVIAKRAAEAPKVDGQLDDAAWAAAAPVRFSTDTRGQDTGIGTEVRFTWTADALYVAFQLDHAGLHTDRSRPLDRDRERLYTEDCVELFLDPDPTTPRAYTEVEIGPFGHFLDLTVDLDRKRYDVAYSSGLTVATTQRPATHQAIIEAVLRAPDLVAALRPGARLPLGLFRMEGQDPRYYLAYSPAHTPKPDFHRPEAFVRLVLTD